MVRMGSPVRFSRGAPPQHYRSGGFLSPACPMLRSRQPLFATDLAVRFVGCGFGVARLPGPLRYVSGGHGRSGRRLTHEAYWAMALPPVLANKPIAAALDSVSVLWTVVTAAAVGCAQIAISLVAGSMRPARRSCAARNRERRRCTRQAFAATPPGPR